MSNVVVGRTLEECGKSHYSREDIPEFITIPPGGGEFPKGSIVLVLRPRRTMKVEFGDRVQTKIFEEISLMPDGRIGVVCSDVRKSTIR